jgi:hypothetical protein
MLFAVLAELPELQSIFDDFFVLSGKIVHVLAAGTLQLNHVILRHNDCVLSSEWT